MNHDLSTSTNRPSTNILSQVPQLRGPAPTYESPPTIPETEHGYLKTLCERMAYYCDHPGFDGYDVTLAELYNLLDYYLANNMLWPLGRSES